MSYSLGRNELLSSPLITIQSWPNSKSLGKKKYICLYSLVSQSLSIKLYSEYISNFKGLIRTFPTTDFSVMGWFDAVTSIKSEIIGDVPLSSACVTEQKAAWHRCKEKTLHGTRKAPGEKDKLTRWSGARRRLGKKQWRQWWCRDQRARAEEEVRENLTTWKDKQKTSTCN